MFVDHRDQTIKAIRQLNQTINPSLFISGEDPRKSKNSIRKEFSTISRGVQTWEADKYIIEDQYFREATTPDLQSTGASSEELDVTEYVIEPDKQSNENGTSDILNVQDINPGVEVVEPPNPETVGESVLESGASIGSRFRALNTATTLVDTIQCGKAENIAVRLQQLANKGPPKGYQQRGRPPTLLRGKERKYICGYCDRDYIWRSSLYRHVKADHAVGKFTCSHCNVPFTHQLALQTHENSRWRVGWCTIQSLHDPEKKKFRMGRHSYAVTETPLL